jgi:hypothetical protein
VNGLSLLEDPGVAPPRSQLCGNVRLGVKNPDAYSIKSPKFIICVAGMRLRNFLKGFLTLPHVRLVNHYRTYEEKRLLDFRDYHHYQQSCTTSHESHVLRVANLSIQTRIEQLQQQIGDYL